MGNNESVGYSSIAASADVEECLREHGDEVQMCLGDNWDPPVHDGLYHVRLAVDPEYENPGCQRTYSRTGDRYACVYLEAEIIRAIEQFAPRDFVGWKLQFSVDTLSFGGQPSRLTRLLQSIGKGQLRRNPSTLLELLSRTTPELLVQVIWKAFSRQKRRDVFVGMRSFPEADGKKLDRFCHDGEKLQAKAQVVDYRPIPRHWASTTPPQAAPLSSAISTDVP